VCLLNIEDTEVNPDEKKGLFLGVLRVLRGGEF